VQKVSFYSGRLFLNTAQRLGCSLDELNLRFCRRGGYNMLLEAGIEQFIVIELWRVTGQIEDLNLVSILCQPLLHNLCVMHTKVVEDEEYFLRRIACQALEKVNQDAGIECGRKDTSAHLPLAGHRGDYAQSETIGFDPQHGCFFFRRIVPDTNIV
jgi:hypothetical protein